MKRKAIGKTEHHIKRKSAGKGSTTPGISLYRIGTQNGHRIDGSGQTRELSSYTAKHARPAKGTIAGTQREQKRQEKQQQLIALSVWEGEGGKIAGRRK